MRNTAIDVYVGVGSNIRPEAELRNAIVQLRREFGALEVSSVYRSPAFGFAGDDFLNVVVRFSTILDPDAVEARLDAIERSVIRTDHRRFAARELDCDLLMYGERVDAARRLPRDDVLRYSFVLGPLAELAPSLSHPLDGRSIESHWLQRRSSAQLTRVCSFEELPLPADAATAIDCQNLSGDVGGVPRKV